jgi:hypothetical protein
MRCKTELSISAFHVICDSTFVLLVAIQLSDRLTEPTSEWFNCAEQDLQCRNVDGERKTHESLPCFLSFVVYIANQKINYSISNIKNET